MKAQFHVCPWPGCSERVPNVLWGCLRHWRRVPHELKTALYHAYKPGKPLTEEWLEVHAEIMEYARRMEGIPPPAPKSKRIQRTPPRAVAKPENEDIPELGGAIQKRRHRVVRLKRMGIDIQPDRTSVIPKPEDFEVWKKKG